MKFSFERWILLIIIGLFVAFCVVFAIKKNQWSSEKTQLLNQLALKDKTIEVSNGVFVKLTTDNENLKLLLDDKTKDIHSLVEQLEQQKQTIVSLTQAVVKWRRAYEGAVNANQTDDPGNPPVPEDCMQLCNKLRTRVDYEKDFGYIKVSGHTLTNPGEGYVKVEQMRPLVLTLALTQGEDGQWKTFVVSSEDNLMVDLKIASVNTKHFEPKWYEKFGIVGTAAAGVNGFYSSIGLSYDIGKFTVTPMYGYYSSSDSYTKMYGAAVIWHPFSR